MIGCFFVWKWLYVRIKCHENQADKSHRANGFHINCPHDQTSLSLKVVLAIFMRLFFFSEVSFVFRFAVSG